MDALRVDQRPNNFSEPKWSRMLILSLTFHVVAFSFILFVPDHMPTRRIRGPVYQVDLVELPKTGRLKAKGPVAAKTPKRAPALKKRSQAKRIAEPTPKQKPAVIAKRTLEKKSLKTKKVTPPKVLNKADTNAKPRKTVEKTDSLIDQAVSKLERKVQVQEKDHVDRAVSRLAGRVRQGRGEAEQGISMRMYQLEVENWIKNNWSYPVALLSRRDLEAIIVVKAKRNGTIVKTWFRRKSSNAIFDESVMKAVERSDPLPPFPEGYLKTYEEFEINFNLKELEG
ncbi:MAG: cell envelope integrity protein TolA [Desulfatiglans sp.]|jgi:colicin import membrane protein|nr:cell envelope integrity protein TolA [Desulfatiglans sp.]